ncbi:MAG: tetratricopeptide repeat protein [Bryobacteraceae bacterium]|nr:tetratricopeptide repeat protein [Bryobacteraceae bacterium]
MRGATAAAVFLGLAALTATGEPPPITIDYPQEGSVFPPEITPPTFLWRDPSPDAAYWRIEIAFTGGAPALQASSRGERLPIGEIDPRAVAATNELPKLTPEQAAARTWKPDPETWEAIKRASVERPATVTISGFRGEESGPVLSRGRVGFKTSKDPVGAPIFYRDVPLMPSELEKGVIKPLPNSALPLIGWRLRDVGQSRSRLLVDGLYTCANCHSFSADGKTLGMDLDGPRNDKGMYAIAPIAPRMTIRNEDVMSWNSFREMPSSPMRAGFMSQVSPDGRFVVTTVNPARDNLRASYYVANFKDYRFLQVFYPTRGILAWYNRATGRIQSLPGADDPAYVQTDAVWSPDGQYLVFARAAAREPYPEGRKMAEYSNDPNETQIQYDLYRIPFNDGRGGRPEPIEGASRNGMSNSFPKVSPDGRWIVFVQSRNGQLMRPDSRLYIVPAGGGKARRMRCNTPLMNSWHSFSPNGRWMVFSSKARSPYTQMYLTHIDEEGNDSPAILIDDATAANRAVNIPEFVNIPPDGMVKIDVPAVEFYRLFDKAWELTQKGGSDEAIEAWMAALEISPEDGRANNNLGALLLSRGRYDEAMPRFETALRVNPAAADGPHNNLGLILMQKKRWDEATAHFEQAIAVNPRFAEARFNLGNAHFYRGRIPEALAAWREGLRIEPHVSVLSQAARVLATWPVDSVRNGREAVALGEWAVKLSEGRIPETFDALAAAYAEAGRFSDAVNAMRRAQALAVEQNRPDLIEGLKARLALYENRQPFREKAVTNGAPVASK